MVEHTTLPVVINGKKIELKIKKDLAWADTKLLLGSLNGELTEGNMIAKTIPLLEKLIQVAVIKTSDDFDPLDHTFLSNMDTTEVTKLIGQLYKQYPLETYINNMGGDFNLPNTPASRKTRKN